MGHRSSVQRYGGCKVAHRKHLGGGKGRQGFLYSVVHIMIPVPNVVVRTLKEHVLPLKMGAYKCRLFERTGRCLIYFDKHEQSFIW